MRSGVGLFSAEEELDAMLVHDAGAATQAARDPLRRNSSDSGLKALGQSAPSVLPGADTLPLGGGREEEERMCMLCRPVVFDVSVSHSLPTVEFSVLPGVQHGMHDACFTVFTLKAWWFALFFQLTFQTACSCCTHLCCFFFSFLFVADCFHCCFA